MGTWAEGSFESDQALDWLDELYRSPQADFVRSTLEHVLGKTKRDRSTRDEVNAVAAADIVACWLGHAPPEPRRAELVNWAQQKLKLTSNFVSLAQEAVRTIKTDSVLSELWEGQHKWLRAMENLEQRLQHPAKHLGFIGA